MKLVFNLSTLEEHYYQTSSEWAVCFSYCREKSLTSSMLNSAHNGSFDSFKKKLPLIHGKQTVSCGDWTTLKETE